MGLDRNKSGVGGSSRIEGDLTRRISKDGTLARVTKTSPAAPVIGPTYGGHKNAEFDTPPRPWYNMVVAPINH